MSEKYTNPTKIETIDDSIEPNDYLDQYEILRPDRRAISYRDRNPTASETKRLVLEDYLSKFSEMVSVIQGRGESGVEDEVPYDTVIFIDKSARPLSWMLSELWDDFAEPVLHTDGKKKIPHKPAVKFLNVDRLFWRDNPQHEGGLRRVSDSEIAELREIFKIGDQNVLDGRRILVVDEIQESGDTQAATKSILEQAFPDATVDTYAYMKGVKKDTKDGSPDYEFPLFPTWYPPKNPVTGQHAESGRGVLDPLSRSNESTPPRRGSQFLSTPPSEKGSQPKIEAQKNRLLVELEAIAQNPASDPGGERRQQLESRLRKLATGLVRRDTGAEKLRRDIKRLSRDFGAGRLQPTVHADRDSIAGKPSEQYRADKRKRDNAPTPLYKL